MKRAELGVVVILMALIGPAVRPASACTNFLITKGASADGSMMITYAADSHDFYGELYVHPAGGSPARRHARRLRVGHRGSFWAGSPRRR